LPGTIAASAKTSANNSDQKDPFTDQVLAALSDHVDKHFYFRQEKKLAILKNPLITDGELFLKESENPADAMVIWDIQHPYKIRYELQQDNIKEIDNNIDNENNGGRIIPSSSNPLAAALTEAMIAAFSGHWENKENLAIVQAEGSMNDWTLNITPRSSELQKLIKHIVLKGSNNMVKQVNILEQNNDSTTIYLTRNF